MAAGLATSASPAHAGTYTVRQCDAAGAGLHPAAPDAVPIESVIAYAARDRCASDEKALRVNSVGDTTTDRFGLWRYEVPSGAELAKIALDARMDRDAGHHPALLVRRDAGNHEIDAGDTNGWKTYDWSAAAGAGWSGLDARLRCNPASGSQCEESAQAEVRVRNLRLTVNDVSAPTLQLDGPLIAGGWRTGTQSLAVSAHDAGGGVRRIEVEVNGATADQRIIDCATIPGDPGVTRMQPCESDALASFDLDTSAPPFHEGNNFVEVCAEDFGTAAVNRSCTSRFVKVDNEAPSAPQNLRVVGGDDWRAVNDFDMEWENPEQSEGAAPIDGVWFRIEDADGETVAGPTFADGTTPGLPAIAVPGAGRFLLSIWLRDQAGNADEAQAAVATLRFDNVAPAPVIATEPSGWLSRRELIGTFEQAWSRPDSPPVSGIKGYALVVDQLPNTNPCETAGDPDPSVCSSMEITHPGEDNRAWSVPNLPEESSWIHIAAVSGSGLRSISVTHVELRADRTDPVTELVGALSGWSNQPATLVAHASDSLSGMQPQAGDDGAPRTCIAIDDAQPICDPDNDVVHVLSQEGDHDVHYWARDLAGNENDGDPGAGSLPPNNQPGARQVRLDLSAPVLSFQDVEDPADPERIRASVSDELSGVQDGEIAYRFQGQTDWTPLPTSIDDGALEAVMPGDQLPDGTYELHAEATDAAGNVAATTERANGDEMVVELPLKVGVELTAKLPSGGRRQIIAYGRPSRIEGRLVDAAGKPLAFEDVAITERFADGAIEAERTQTAITDGDGRYALALPSGPSREVGVSFDGSQTHTNADSPYLDLGVRGDASLRASKRRPRVGQRFVFKGKVRRKGTEIPPGGKLVELQVKRPEGWDTVRQAFRTKGSGRWRFGFRFGDYYLRPTTFRFRLKVAREGSWPYRLATTRSKRVTVVPR